MNYCIRLKKRKNKPYCKLLDREITLSECNSINSENKCREYKTKNEENLSYKNKKSTVYSKNSAKMKNKSNKLAKLERNRNSVFTDNLEHCYLCCKKKNDLHEIFGGRNRLNSIRYNLVLPLCRECHSLKQNQSIFQRLLAQARARVL